MLRPPSWRGKHHSEESKKKTSKTLEGHIVSKEIRDKIARTLSGGHPFSIETKRKMGERILRARNPRWKGGITPEITRIRNSKDLQLWREAVYTRDNFTCQICQKQGGRLQAHHIKSFSKFPELRFIVNNGVTFCKSCHIMLHKKLWKEMKDVNI